MSLLFANQRWRQARSYRPPDEPIRTAEYDVAELSDDAAEAFSLPIITARPTSRTLRFGLFHRRSERRCGLFPSNATIAC